MHCDVELMSNYPFFIPNIDVATSITDHKQDMYIFSGVKVDKMFFHKVVITFLMIWKSDLHVMNIYEVSCDYDFIFLMNFI